MADGFEGCLPSNRLEVLGKVVGCDESQDVSFEATDIGIAECLNDGSLMVRFIRSAWLLVHGWYGLVGVCSMPLSLQTRSKI